MATASRDEDGWLLDNWACGRCAERSGHRLGTAEIESALVAHPEDCRSRRSRYSAILKVRAIYAYVTLSINGRKPSPGEL